MSWFRIWDVGDSNPATQSMVTKVFPEFLEHSNIANYSSDSLMKLHTTILKKKCQNITFFFQNDSHGEAMTITQLKGYALFVGSGLRTMLGY